MLFCERDERAMARRVRDGELIYHCTSCGAEKPGSAADARLSGAVYGASETVSMYNQLVMNAPFDPTNQNVSNDCECGLDYAVQIRVGDAEVVIKRCKCGR